ncbi:MAG: hypothetical protein K9I82_03230 [Chitinophagaceae bacterium]|nr:hypothetical protein [Chitinophagaceae bacterium]
MKTKTSFLKKSIWLNLIIIIIICTAFIHTINIRNNSFGKISPDSFTFLTGSTTVFTNNWINQNPFHINFALYEKPFSVESVKNQSLYISYPPGSIVPIYILCKVFNTKATPKLIMAYNMFNHLLISLLLSFLTLLLIKDLDYNWIGKLILSLISGLSYLYFKALLIWHQIIYFADTAVLPLFFLVIFLELFKDKYPTNKHTRKLNIFQSFIIICGTLTDWLFIPLLLCMYIKRLLNNQIRTNSIKIFFKETLNFFLPAIISFLLFCYQLTALNGWKLLENRFLSRISKKEVIILEKSIKHTFWVKHIMKFSDGYLIMFFALLSLFVIITFNIIKNKIKKDVIFKNKNETPLIFNILLISFIPCILYNFIVKNHADIHPFSVAKFGIIFSLTISLIIPLLINDFFNSPKISQNHIWLKINSYIKKLYPFIGILLSIYLIQISRSIKIINRYQENDTLQKIGYFIKKNTNFYSTIFSDSYVQYQNPPQQVALTYKLIYNSNYSKSKIDSLLKIPKIEINFFSNKQLSGTEIIKVDSLLVDNFDILTMKKNIESTASMNLEVTPSELQDFILNLNRGNMFYLYRIKNKSKIKEVFN